MPMPPAAKKTRQASQERSADRQHCGHNRFIHCDVLKDPKDHHDYDRAAEQCPQHQKYRDEPHRLIFRIGRMAGLSNLTVWRVATARPGYSDQLVGR
jgi:hypothetical protein